MIRVLHCFTDPRLGGPGIRSIEISNHLSSDTMQFGFLIPKGHESLRKKVDESGFEVHRTSQPRIRRPRQIRENIEFLSSIKKSSRDITNIVEENEYDILHANSALNIPAALGGKMSEANLLWHFNDTLAPFPLSNILGLLGENMADQIATSSRQTAEHYGLSKSGFKLFYPPVNLRKFNSDSINIDECLLYEEFDLEPDRPMVASIGNVNPVKGYHSLIKSFNNVVREIGPANLVIAGSILDTHKEYYNRLIELIEDLDLQDSVYILGWRSDVLRILNSADMLVVSSISETGPMTALEAMAVNCPVVSTPVGIMDEVAEDGKHVWITKSNNPSDIGNSILDAINSPEERERRASNARQLVEEKFSVNVISKKHLETYRHLCN